MDIPYIPIGFRFEPSDEQLVTYYLKKKVLGEFLPCNIIVERDMYEKSPWEVFCFEDPWVQNDDEKEISSIYVFTTLKLMGKKRIARTAGNGSWHGETGPKEIKDLESGKVIAKKEMFSYRSKDQTRNGQNGHWYMHEYTLTCSSFEGIPKFVLCKITLDNRKKLKIGPPPKQIKKKSVNVANQEVTNCSLALQSDQYNANYDIFSDGFLQEFDEMFKDLNTNGVTKQDGFLHDLQEFDEMFKDFETNGVTKQDGDLEHAAKKMRVETIQFDDSYFL